MALTVNWRGSDELRDGHAKAPTDTGLESGNPAARDGEGREYLEAKELAVNTNASDPCIWLRKSDGTLAKFRPTGGIHMVNRRSDLPSITPGASPLRDGDTFLVRHEDDGTTAINRLVVFDKTLNAGAGDWNWEVSAPPKLTALADVDHSSQPALGTMPIWTYPAGASHTSGKFYWNSPNAHLKNYDSTIHWESGSTVFHQGHIWRATQENSNIEPVLEPGKTHLFIHIPGEPSFALIPTGISAAPPPAGTQPMGAMRFAYWLQYTDDHTMKVWKFKITGKNPGTGKLEGVWEVKSWPCVAWRHPIAPPTRFDPLSVFVWIYDEPTGTATPVIGQQAWAQIHMSMNISQGNDVNAPFPKHGDVLVYDGAQHKYVNMTKAQFLAMP